MTIYEYVKQEQNDFDIWDEVFDDCVTICYIDEEDENTDNYYRFCVGIMKLVKINRVVNNAVIADWYNFIYKNEKIFMEWSKKMWREGTIPEDEDDFIYDWLTELHGMLSGGMSESAYKLFVEDYLPRLEV